MISVTLLLYCQCNYAAKCYCVITTAVKFIFDNSKKNTKITKSDKSENINYRMTKELKNYTFCQSKQ